MNLIVHKNISYAKVLNLLHLQNIMKDKWINIGYEDDELRPYQEPMQDFNDQRLIGRSFKCMCSC